MRARLLAALLLASPAVLACNKGQPAGEAQSGFKLIHADDLEKMRTSGKVEVYDANAPDFRKQYGIVPGAHLLSGLQYDPKELPAEKGTPLVFYCANTH